MVTKKMIKQNIGKTEGKTGAVFLDRDGTINVEVNNYVKKIEDFKFLSQSVEALKLLSKTNYKLIVITNQGGIAKGISTIKEIEKINDFMVNELKKQGVELHKVYFCPHHEQGILKEYTKKCECRKPGTKMYLDAANDFNIDIGKSWVVGDQETDIGAGINLGCKTILVKSGIRDDLYYNSMKYKPDFIVNNLLEAVKIIKKMKNN